MSATTTAPPAADPAPHGAPPPGAGRDRAAALRGRLRAGWPYALLALALVAAGWFLAERDVGGPPLDPTSTAPDGTRALVETLEGVGAEVVVSAEAPDADVDAVLVLLDDRDDAGRAELRDWTAAGGTLVVADPTSPLTPEVVGVTAVGVIDSTIPRRCDVPALGAVERVSAPGGAVYEVPADATGCFPRGQGSWLTVTAEGDGAVVALGGQGALVNASLGEADNALLAASLLVPVDGAVVQLLLPPLPGGGEAGLADLVPDRVYAALLQLAIAFLVVVAWRSRRLGRPVTEPQPVAVPGSELTVAVGGLLQQVGARAQAAALLRDDLRRVLAERFGLPASVPPEGVADAVAARTGVDRSDVLEALTGPDPADDRGLLELAGAVDRVRDAALAPHAPDAAAGPDAAAEPPPDPPSRPDSGA